MKITLLCDDERHKSKRIFFLMETIRHDFVTQGPNARGYMIKRMFSELKITNNLYCVKPTKTCNDVNKFRLR